MMFLTILINSTVQERTILLHKSQTDLKLEHKARRQTVWKNTENGNKADGALIFSSHTHGFVYARWFKVSEHLAVITAANSASFVFLDHS